MVEAKGVSKGSTVGKVGPVAKTVANKAGSAVATVGTGVGTAASATKGFALGAAATAGSSFVNAIKDPGLVLFILGMVTFWWDGLLQNQILSIGIATIFLFYSVFFIFKGKGFISALIFWLWYIPFGGATDIELVVRLLFPLVLFGMLLRGTFARFTHRDTFFNGAAQEAIGLVPILLFLFDLGLIEFLTQFFQMTLGSVSRNFIIFTPWWAMLGIFLTKKDNLFINLLKAAAGLYIIALITIGIVPDAVGASQSIIPGPASLLEAKQEFREQFPAGEHPLLSNFYCGWSIIAGGTKGGNFAQCIKERQLMAQIEAECKEKEEVAKGFVKLKDCIKTEQERRAESTTIDATTDQTITPTEVSVTIPSGQVEFDQFPSYSAGLFVENPQNLNLSLEINCTFVKGSQKIQGKILTGRNGVQAELLPVISISSQGESIPLLCSPVEPIEAEKRQVYEMQILTTIKSMKTKSFLKRAFLPQFADEQIRKTKIAEVLRDQFNTREDIQSRAPAEFARINLEMEGTEVLDNGQIAPVIDAGETPLFIATVENVAKGRLLQIRNYHFSLQDRGFSGSGGSVDCLQGKSIALPREVPRQFTLAKCFIIPPAELRSPTSSIAETFSAELEYDYQIKTTQDVQVQTLRLAGGQGGGE